MNPSVFSLHQCQALCVPLPTKCCVGIATFILYMLVNHGELALRVAHQHRKADQEASSTEG